MFKKTGEYRNLAIVGGISLVFCAVIVIGIRLILDHNISTAIKDDTLDHTAHVSQQILSDLPEIETIIKDARPTPEFHEHLNDILVDGEGLTQLKVYDANGLLRFVLDEAKWISSGGERQKLEQAAMASDGASSFEPMENSVANGSNGFAVTATKPVLSPDNEVIGFIEMTFDHTESLQTFRRSFEWLIFAIPTLMSLSFLMPTIAWLLMKNRNIKSEKLVQNLKRRDGLTGLMNRSTFSEVAYRIFQSPAQPPLQHGLVIVDIHRFRSINDSLGHNVGDALLRHVATTIKAALRDDDIVARFGNDEFMAVLPNVRPEELARAVNRVMSHLRRPFAVGDTKISCHLCIGTHLAAPNETLDEVILSADMALSHAKICGPDTITAYSADLDERNHRRRKIEVALRDAWECGRTYLAFQPVIDAKTRRVAGFEALLRMRLEDGEQVSPEEFVPIAEQTNLILKLGQTAIERALECARDWPADIFVAINLSPAQFRRGDLVENARQAIETSGIPPDRVEFEITENLLLDEEPEVKAQFDDLKALGVSIAMDDFGTGYSSLGYLLKHDFDKLKIDRIFLEDLKDDPLRQEKILKSIIDLGQQLDLRLTVEGVETTDQVDMLAKLGCDLFQGFYFSGPISPEDAQALVVKENSGAA